MKSDGGLRIALIGDGFMGKAHTHGYTDVGIFFPMESPIKQVICARSPSVQQNAERWGWNEWETDWRRVIDRPDIDVVDVCAPSRIHKEVVLAAAASGKHVFCEKPLAMNVADAREMVDAASKAGVVHGIGFNYRKVPAIALAKRLIDQGAVGDVYHVRGIYSQDWLVDQGFPAAWRLRREDAGGGASWDMGAHIIDLARFLVGEIESVVGQQSTFVQERPVAVFEEGLMAEAGPTNVRVTVDDATSFLARFENGAMGLFEATRVAGGYRNHHLFEVLGSRGSIRFNMERMNELDYFSMDDEVSRQGWRTIIVGQSDHPYMGNWWPAGHIIGYGDTFVNQAYDFLTAASHRTMASPSLADGLRCQEILAAIDQSMAQKRWVSVAEMR